MELAQLNDPIRIGVCSDIVDTLVRPRSLMLSTCPDAPGTNRRPFGVLKLFSLVNENPGDQVMLGPISRGFGLIVSVGAES